MTDMAHLTLMTIMTPDFILLFAISFVTCRS